MSDPAISEAGPEGARLAPDFSEKFGRLKAILRTIFQLDRGDLDFGLYRIMNLKAEEIIGFLDNDLLPQVRTALAGNTANRQVELEKKLAKARGLARDLGVPPETTPKVIDLERQLAEAKADAAAETDVYNHLANFFARYYNEGDFMSLRRYSGGSQPTYLIPYDGEEVKLHWANQDQYYVKSTENYASYVFTVGKGAEKRRVRFEIAKADNEKDNIKEVGGRQRRFLLAESETTKPALSAVEGAVELDNGELVIRFEHRPLTEREKRSYPGSGSKQQDRINEAACKRVLKVLEPDWLTLLATLAPTESNPDRTVLDKHLAVYTAKNSFDYFIHKDLGGFLCRELDLYLKTDVLNLDDLAMGDAARLNRALARMRAVRHVAGKIITFLAQIEDFQKQLWLKKKFVLDTQYCVTLDRVPEALYPEIVANEAQREEWVELFAIDEIKGDLANGNTGFSKPLTVEFLQANKNLLIDTAWFSSHFTEAVLNAQTDLDENLSGVVVSSDATQSARLLKRWLSGRVGVLLADPPYNTGSDGFPYKDNYQHASWLTMISDCLVQMKTVMPADALCACFIDDHEVYRLGFVMNEVFGESQRAACAPWKSEASGGKEKTGLRTGHEYILIYHNGDGTCITQTEISTGNLDREDRWGKYRKGRELRKWGGTSSRSDRPGQWFPLPAPDGSMVLPIKNDGSDGHWRWGKENSEMKKALDNSEVFHWEKCSYEQDVVVDAETERWVPFEKIRDIKKSVGWGTWLDSIGTNADATRELKEMFGKKPFETPKASSIYRWLISLHDNDDRYVVDFYAGSGTVAQAVINLNQQDNGYRKYILAEVGDHFNTVLLPRIKKVVYSPDWKDGKPISRDGSTQFFKYIRLESYEDTLDSLDVTPRSSEQEELLAQNPALAEDYRLRYALGEETSGSACLLGKYFTDPFAYTLSVVRDGVRQEAPVDLPETFNFLIGLRVESHQRIDGVLTISARMPRAGVP